MKKALFYVLYIYLHQLQCRRARIFIFSSFKCLWREHMSIRLDQFLDLQIAVGVFVSLFSQVKPLWSEKQRGWAACRMKILRPVVIHFHTNVSLGVLVYWGDLLQACGFNKSYENAMRSKGSCIFNIFLSTQTFIVWQQFIEFALFWLDTLITWVWWAFVSSLGLYWASLNIAPVSTTTALTNNLTVTECETLQLLSSPNLRHWLAQGKRTAVSKFWQGFNL